MQDLIFDPEPLKKWFEENQRDFPWRENRSPYRVWVSEVMLQQTRAQVVVPYFERWMDLFPTISSLAEASQNEVIKAWEGLGYYSRARNLHEGARAIVKKWGGVFPQEEKYIKEIKGIGPYTLGAILSFAFNKKKGALDGNVIRVLTRFFLITEDVGLQRVKTKLYEILEKILCPKKPHVMMEALIELGALVCSKTPSCSLCPLKKGCMAYQKKRAEELPIKTSKGEVKVLRRVVLLIKCEKKILLQKKSSGLMADLYEFPYVEKKNETLSEWKEHVQSSLGLEVEFCKKMKQISHSFTRYKAFLFPLVFKTKEEKKVLEHQWISLDQALLLPFSSGHRKLLKNFTESHK